MIEATIAAAPHAEKRGGDERRRLKLAAVAAHDRGPQAIEILDLSRTGLMMAGPADFRVGEAIVVVLPELGEWAARVAWSKDGRHGCRFEEPLSRAELSAALLRAGPAAQGASRETLGMRLKRLRKASHFTMLGLADAVGVSKPTLWKWESDKVRPRDDAVRSLAAALDIEEIALLYGTSDDAEMADELAETDVVPRGETVAETIAAARRAIAEHAGVPLDQVRIAIDWD